MIINREWAMPNGNTFSIKPITNLILKYKNSLIGNAPIIIDPFANNCKIATITNDIDRSFDTTYHLDALEFLQKFNDNSVDMVLYDPPYSPRQISECYKRLNLSVNMETTQASYWSNQKNEIARILKPNGICLSFGWNSNGIGLNRGFDILELMLVAHGGNHNDTICVVEQKINKLNPKTKLI